MAYIDFYGWIVLRILIWIPSDRSLVWIKNVEFPLNISTRLLIKVVFAIKNSLKREYFLGIYSRFRFYYYDWKNNIWEFNC